MNSLNAAGIFLAGLFGGLAVFFAGIATLKQWKETKYSLAVQALVEVTFS